MEQTFLFRGVSTRTTPNLGLLKRRFLKIHGVVVVVHVSNLQE